MSLHNSTITQCAVTIAVFNLLLLLLHIGGIHGKKHMNDQRSSGSSSHEMSTEQRCRLFSQVNEIKQEFYSPLHPANYPKNTDCTLILKANYGQVIRIDFRNKFDMEPSEECIYDFLEIRDGAHGYSESMGKFCGRKFPPIITSKDRYLWLRFKSDENTEYSGFQAVYEFVENTALDRPEIQPCIIQMSGKQGIITQIDIPAANRNYSITYDVPLDCTWIVTVEPEEKLYTFFESFQLQEPNECTMNYVDIFGAQTDMDTLLHHFCGSVAENFVIEGSVLHFRYFSIKEAINGEFLAYFTAFRELVGDEDDSECREDEYDCDDATCIDISLQCNGVANCRHQYDEEGCDAVNNGGFNIDSEHMIVILTLGCGLLGGMCFAMCFNCIKKLIRDGRQIQENIRRSREGGLERTSRSQSELSSPKLSRHTLEDGRVTYIHENSKTNGRVCPRSPSEDESDIDDEEDEEEEELEDDLEHSVEMRDCECQTRDSLMTQRDSTLRDTGMMMPIPATPPPPPPPTRRPPRSLPMGPAPGLPTPPPPPLSHCRGSHYGSSGIASNGVSSSRYDSSDAVSNYSSRPVDHYENDPTPPQPVVAATAGPTPTSEDPYGSQRFRAEAVIEMKNRGSQYEPAKARKATPDVIVTH